jgi:hypothetical protein
MPAAPPGKGGHVSAEVPRPRAAESGLTVADLARRYRVSPDKVRAWIRRGELAAVNTASALCGKPRWVVTAEALAAFEKRRGGPPPAPPRRRRRPAVVDYYPD